MAQPRAAERNASPGVPNGERRYRHSKGWVVLGCSCGACFFLGGPLLAYKILTDAVPRGTGTFVFFVLFAAALMLLGSWTAVGSVRYRLILAEDRVSYRGAFKERTLRLTEIAGYRLTRGGAWFYPVDKTKRRFLVVLPTKADDFLDAWFAGVVNLNETELREELEHLLEDSALGGTRPEREERLLAAHSIVRWVEGAVLLLGLASLLSPHAYLSIGLLLWPWCLALLFLWLRPAVGVDVAHNSARADLVASVFLPPAVLAVHALRGPRLWHWVEAVGLAILVGALLAVVWGLCLGTRRRREHVTLVVTAAIYGAAAVPVANHVLDRGVIEQRVVTVRGKRVSEGKFRRYHVVVDGAGFEDFDGDLSVRYSIYERLEDGGPACVEVHPGALSLPWLSVRPACDGDRRGEASR